MKRFILIIAILLFTSLSWAGDNIQLARMNVAIAGASGGGAAGPNCEASTFQFESVASTDATQNTGATNAQGNSFKVTSDSYIYSITYLGYIDTAETYTLRWGNSHDLTTYYKEVTATSTNAGNQTMTFLVKDATNKALAGTTYYWAVIRSSATGQSNIARQSGNVYTDGQDLYSGTAWHTDTASAATLDFRFSVYVCQ